ncbi:MAG: PEP/pyruvate-binding domain-containing protein, partial [Anaerolineae bacterium]
MASSPAELDGDSEAGITRAFLWRGDVRLLATIIKLAEDAANARRDARIAGVRTILLVEDGIPFYSTYLPMLFSEVTRQTDRLISQGVNTGQRLLRRRLRPRIVHATTFEEAWRLYSEFAATLLCVISDVRFPREGDLDAHAGIRLLRAVRDDNPEIPLLLQSSQPSAAMEAAALGATFVNKDSPTLLHDFHAFMLRNLGFGDFVFRQPDGSEVGRAHDVPSMLEALASVPDESLRHHALRNHFSNWLMARTEFALASNLRKRHVADFPSVDDVREFLCATFTGVMAEAGRGQVVDFDRDRVGPPNPFVRIGGGSLGGKGRGLAFMHALLGQGNLTSQSDALSYQVPESAVIGTEVFERFLDDNELVEFALCEESDARILEAFQAADLPAETEKDLEAYLGDADFPLAVRSSSLLEDSRHFPAAGIYPTHMLPNTGPLPDRLARLLSAIKHVYASSFFSNARAYLAGAPGRVEDERMAVVLQRLAGRRHGRYLYPDISGVARSYNVYPVDDMPAEEGVVVAALGLGRTVVEGGRAIRFSPGRPRIPPHLTTPEDIVEHAQREFWALDLTRWPDTSKPAREDNLELLGLEAAREHGTLAAVASVYSNANNRVYRGLSREGVPLVTLAPLLRRGGFPLAEALRALLELGEAGLAGPVEIEFAVVLDPSTTGRGTVAFLQIRPMATGATEATVDIGSTVPEDLFVGPCRALGAGV